tara:strand:- start:474 stop:698 length:225 start_codon:yes stop_codon:yes gene_type:complete
MKYTPEEENIIVEAARILIPASQTSQTPEPPAPASTEPEGASFGSFFLKSSLFTAAILVMVNWDAITSFFVVTK